MSGQRRTRATGSALIREFLEHDQAFRPFAASRSADPCPARLPAARRRTQARLRAHRPSATHTAPAALAGAALVLMGASVPALVVGGAIVAVPIGALGVAGVGAAWSWWQRLQFDAGLHDAVAVSDYFTENPVRLLKLLEGHLEPRLRALRDRVEGVRNDLRRDVDTLYVRSKRVPGRPGAEAKDRIRADVRAYALGKVISRIDTEHLGPLDDALHEARQLIHALRHQLRSRAGSPLGVLERSRWADNDHPGRNVPYAMDAAHALAATCDAAAAAMPELVALGRGVRTGTRAARQSRRG